MKFLVQWKGLPTAENAVIERFMKIGAPMPDGVQLLGRWHAIGGLRGVAVVETDDTSKLAALSLAWGDLLTMSVFPALTDDELGAALGAYQAARH